MKIEQLQNKLITTSLALAKEHDLGVDMSTLSSYYPIRLGVFLLWNILAGRAHFGEHDVATKRLE